LVRYLLNQKLYGLKVVSKELAFENKDLEHVKAERDILVHLAGTEHPFLMNLHFSFQSESYLHLFLDFCAGGDLAGQVFAISFFLILSFIPSLFLPFLFPLIYFFSLLAG